ncbi:MAG: ImmA/IrrE family metallo-endopeptidase [Pseudobdellovibrionaceae bacterium]
MRYVKDKTGRFSERPHYEPKELDQACEKIIVDFMRSQHGTMRLPIDTEDIKNLIERDTDYLDCYADLSEYGSDVEGVTIFQPGKKPIVKISKKLTENDRYENRLRTTLTHEYGHVHFHAYLFTLDQDQDSFFQNQKPQSLVSKRENILNAPVTDWMEWQAGYACGALLMPLSNIQKIAAAFLETNNHFGPISPDGAKGSELIAKVVETFKVSVEAAKIRLLKLEILGSERGPSLIS